MCDKGPKSSKYGYLAKNTLLFAISSLGSKILIFLLVPLYTNILSTNDYGVADLVITTSNLLVYIFTLEISSAVLRFAIERNSKQGEILSFGLKVVTIGSAILTVLVLSIRNLHLFGLPDYFYVFLLLYFLGNSLNTILSSYLRAIDDVIGCVIAGISSTIIMLGGNILALVILRWGIIGYLVSLVASQFVAVLYMAYRIWKSRTFSFMDKCERRVKKDMLCYSTPLIFNGIGWWINNSLDKYFVIGMIDAAANGIFAAALKIPTILSIFQTIFTQAWNLSAIKEFDKDDKDGFFKTIYNTYNAGLVLLTSILIVLNVPLAHFLFAKDFFVAWKCSSILLMSALFSALGGFIGSIFAAVKNSKIFAYSTVSAAVLNVVLNYFLILWIGIEGAAIATTASFFVMWLIRLVCAKKVINLNLSLFRDFMAYILLCMQIFMDHTDDHRYVVQVIIIFILMRLYYKEIVGMVKKFVSTKRN